LSIVLQRPTFGFMKTKAIQGARLLLGLIFFVFGLNGFFHFIPQPPMSGPPGNFLGALIATGYFFPLLKLTEVAAGALLLSGLLVPLALTVLAPVIVNIVAFHSFLAPSGLPVPIVVVVLEIVLARAYWSAFAGLMRLRAAPDSAKERPAAPAASSLHDDAPRTELLKRPQGSEA
jgi:putative oxidoreductase